ncbi:hypothetical protein MUDAN_DOGOELCO_00684 [Lactiplantibacillus mudanjiangensis]|uniref:hypothetical protein n=1 Tax=Lactiplantibacillus mudanjiangensis TaxID=1296538 RepID=UPI001014B581|nr:hypothetical protein [Lactiplantibacillus mudanjiangensis]VDG31183.1 hypothetical protein MUDAN_DOGOELCO_00684 [Lactiplantibacillus mudanjiangensis]
MRRKKYWGLGFLSLVGLLICLSLPARAGTPLMDSRFKSLHESQAVRTMKVNLMGAAIITASGGLGLICWYRAKHYE